MPDSTDFVRHTGLFRKELLAHCYRMLGSVHDAEDLVQETYLRAWRSYDGFEGRASLRTWLFRIATNACLNALEQRGRRALPSGLGEAGGDPDEPLAADLPAETWVQPIPDALLTGDPAGIVTAREGMRLALVAAFQHLPPRQRAVLLLRDVLRWRAAEVADLLGTTATAVNSALQRARAQLEQAAPAPDEVVEPADAEQRELLDRYAMAFETADIPALMRLLTEDAVWEMPPVPTWFAGRAAIEPVVAACPSIMRGGRMLPTRANGQPAFGYYRPAGDGVQRPFALQVLTVTKAGVSHVVAYHDTGLFALFGLPPAVR